jgi:hypothetical protein
MDHPDRLAKVPRPVFAAPIYSRRPLIPALAGRNAINLPGRLFARHVRREAALAQNLDTTFCFAEIRENTFKKLFAIARKTKNRIASIAQEAPYASGVVAMINTKMLKPWMYWRFGSAYRAFTILFSKQPCIIIHRHSVHNSQVSRPNALFIVKIICAVFAALVIEIGVAPFSV